MNAPTQEEFASSADGAAGRMVRDLAKRVLARLPADSGEED